MNVFKNFVDLSIFSKIAVKKFWMKIRDGGSVSVSVSVNIGIFLGYLAIAIYLAILFVFS